MNFAQKIGFLLMCMPVLFGGLFFCINTGTVHADTEDTVGNNGNGTGDTVGNNGQQQIQKVELKNPLSFNTLQDLIVAILNIFMVLMIPIIVFFIILAGFKYVTAQGNPGKIEEATATFTYAVIGGVLILAAVAIAEIIKNTVQSF